MKKKIHFLAVYFSATIILFLLQANSVLAFEPLFYSSLSYDVGDGPESVFAGDLDGDSDLDLAVANNNSYNVSVLLNNGDGTYAPAENYVAGNGPASVFAGDFGGDGDLDLAVANNNSYNVSVLLNNGDGTYAGAANYSAGNGPASVFAGDFDGDSDLDLAVANNNSYNVSVLLNNGDGTYAGAVNYSAGDGPASVFAGDLDGDSDLDLAVANNNSDNVSVLFNNGDGTYDSTPTMLHSCMCSLSEDGVEISWQLSEAGKSMDFSVYREEEGSGRFLPIQAEIARTEELSYKIVDKSYEPGSSYRYRVDVIDDESMRMLFVTEIVKTETPKLALSQNYPNPFNPSTTIYYSIPERSRVTLDIYDVSGRRIVRLEDSVKKAGRHKKEWAGRNKDEVMVSSGVYFYKLTTGKKSITKKMILLR